MFALRFLAIEGVKPSFMLVREYPDERYLHKFQTYYRAYGGSGRFNLETVPKTPWIHLKVEANSLREFRRVAAELDCRIRRKDKKR